MAPKALAVTALLVACVSAIRKRQSSEVGGIDGLYTFGSPGVATVGIKNKRSADGCFPGARTWTKRREGLTSLSDGIDLVVPLARPFGYRHPYVGGVELDITREEAKRLPCSEALVDAPRSVVLKWELHKYSLYADQVTKLFNDLYGNLTYMTTATAKELDPAFVRDEMRKRGWRLVGHAFDNGSILLGGPQASHLLQNPDTMECMVTFRGSMSTKDYFADADIRKVDFCGFEEEFHRGFRDHYRRIVRSEGWQTSIRPAMASCSKLYSTGHSLGGAKATLFAACLQSAPAGDDDYQFISFSKGRPAVLPEYQP